MRCGPLASAATAYIGVYRVALTLPSVASGWPCSSMGASGTSAPKGHLPAPKANAQFWQAKFRENRRRDEAAVASLGSMGWTVMTFWECDLREDMHGAVERLRASVAT